MISDNEQENEKRETVADIVAIVRRAAQYYDGEADKSEGLLRGIFKLSAANYREIANLVEAAWKREREELERYAVSKMLEGVTIVDNRKGVNAAAMRESVETALTTIRGVINGTIARTNNSVFDCRDKLKAALSAPARNCDLYKNKKDAEAAFISEECKHPCGDCTVCDEYGCALVHECGVEWLFATAERKGEGDGR